MNGTKIIQKLKSSRSYSRDELFLLFKGENPELSRNSFSWILAELEAGGNLFRVGHNSYSREKDGKNRYLPRYSKQAVGIMEEMLRCFHGVCYMIFETDMLNEFLNHMLAQNIVVLQVEKELSFFVFDFFNRQFPGKVLYKPRGEDISNYASSDSIIIENLITESPAQKENSHFFTIEKLLVDCVCDKVITELFSESETSAIFENAASRYKIDIGRLKRYAQRRSAWNRTEQFLAGEDGA